MPRTRLTRRHHLVRREDAETLSAFAQRLGQLACEMQATARAMYRQPDRLPSVAEARTGRP